MCNLELVSENIVVFVSGAAVVAPNIEVVVAVVFVVVVAPSINLIDF